MNVADYNKLMESLIARYTGPMEARARKAAARAIHYIKFGQSPDIAIRRAFREAGLTFDAAALTPLALRAFSMGYIQAGPRIVEGRNLAALYRPAHDLSTILHHSDIRLQSDVTEIVTNALKEKTAWVDLSRKIYDGYGFEARLPVADLPKYLKELQESARRLISMGGGTQEEILKHAALVKRVGRQVERLSALGAPTKAMRAGYKQLVKAAEKGGEKALNTAVRVAIEERSRYYADRIARTELSMARHQGFSEEVQQDETVNCLKWQLNSRHPEFDICDLHANANFYGLGAGIYPTDKFPTMPAHPFCMCFAVAIRDDRRAAKPFEADKGASFLRQLPAAKRQRILGVRGDHRFQNSGQWQQQARGWQGHAPLP